MPRAVGEGDGSGAGNSGAQTGEFSGKVATHERALGARVDDEGGRSLVAVTAEVQCGIIAGKAGGIHREFCLLGGLRACGCTLAVLSADGRRRLF